jgi:hypothetical protein
VFAHLQHNITFLPFNGQDVPLGTDSYYDSQMTTDIRIPSPGTQMLESSSSMTSEGEAPTFGIDFSAASRGLGAYRPQHQMPMKSSYNSDKKSSVSSCRSYDNNYNYEVSYVHPVVAAMFIPNIKKCDNYFLFTNRAKFSTLLSLKCVYL